MDDKAVYYILFAAYLGLSHIGMRHEDILDFFGVNVLSTANDQVFESSNNAPVTIRLKNELVAAHNEIRLHGNIQTSSISACFENRKSQSIIKQTKPLVKNH